MSRPERLATLLQPSTTPLRTPRPVSSLIVQIQLSRMARERPTWSACRAIEAQSSYPILDANILPGLHPVPLFEIFFRTTYLEPLRTFLQAQGLLHATQPLLPQVIQRHSATYNRSKDKFMRAASLNGFSLLDRSLTHPQNPQLQIEKIYIYASIAAHPIYRATASLTHTPLRFSTDL